jgi:hypothetical protein
MSADVSGEITAIATAVLAAFAIVTAIFAILAFRKQSQEVIDQASMLKVQSERLDEQRKVNAEQVKVLALQAEELRESVGAERKRAAEVRRRAQATRVSLKEMPFETVPGDGSTGYHAALGTVSSPAVRVDVKNSSDQPIYGAELRWHRGSEGYGEPNPQPLGTLMPGEDAKAIRGFSPGTNLAASGAVLRFRDAAGATWIRRPDGGLVEQ